MKAVGAVTARKPLTLNARHLNEHWGVGAKHALYRADGTWYHRLRRFPGALFDANGWVLFASERGLEQQPGILIGKGEKNWISVPKGISSLPGYVAHASVAPPAAADENAPEGGQGFQSDPAMRKAIEDYAVGFATAHYRGANYEVIVRGKPYDLECVRDGAAPLYIEVKGTQTAAESIILTRGEVEWAHSHPGACELFVVHSINVQDGRPSGGVPRLVAPWSPDPAMLTPIAYEYRLPQPPG